MNYLFLTIKEIHEALISGLVTPKELVTEALDLAKKDNFNCFEYICEKEALDAVNKLDPSKKDSLFYGIPFVAKDNFSTKDIPTSGSSNILNGYVPVFSSEVIVRLIDSGAILIGKTTLDELAMGGSGTTGRKGITFNPYDSRHEHLIGGSSSGSAAAVCSGIVPFSLGSDTGDSVRKPASYGGIVGFKPTWGRISRYGLFPFATSLDHVAYFTRSVFDSAALLNLLAGHDEKDFSSSFEKVIDYTKDIGSPLKGKKIGVINQILSSFTSQEIIHRFKESLSYLESLGAKICYFDMDIDLLSAIFPTYIVISCAEATSNNANLDGINFGNRKNGDTYEDIMLHTRTEGFSNLIKRRFVIGSYSLYKENQYELFIRAQKARRLIVNAFNDIFKECDVIYLPATPTTAPLKENHHIDAFSLEYLIADNYMCFANMGGFPSLTLPLGKLASLPFGANITSKPFDEKSTFNIAYHLENFTGLKNLHVKEEK